MKCPRCKSVLPDLAKFCGECGRLLRRYCMHCRAVKIDEDICPACGKGPPSSKDVVKCPNCENVVPDNAKYCSECGQLLKIE